MIISISFSVLCPWSRNKNKNVGILTSKVGKGGEFDRVTDVCITKGLFLFGVGKSTTDAVLSSGGGTGRNEDGEVIYDSHFEFLHARRKKRISRTLLGGQRGNNIIY